MDSEDYHYKFKVCIMGDKHVGKSTLIDSMAVNFSKSLEVEVSEE